MKKQISYDFYSKNFYTDITVKTLTAFQCDCCGKIFKCKNDLDTYDLPLKFPTLTFSTPSNYNSIQEKQHFCSLTCLFELLKKVPYGFEVFTPTYFTYMNRRDHIFQRDWDEIIYNN